QPVGGRLLRGEDPVVRDPGRLRAADHLGVVGVQDDVALGAVELLLVLGRGRLGDPVGVVQHQPDVAQAAHAGLRAHRGLALLDARVAEGALLGLAGAVVEVDLLVRAAGDAHAPAAAGVLVHQDDAVLLALVDRAGRARGHAGGVQAVLADARQVEHEGLIELELDLLLDALEHRVLVLVQVGAAEVVVPVPGPLDLRALTGDQRLRGRGGDGVLLRGGGEQVVVLVGPRLVVVLDAGQLRVGEQLQELRDAPAGLELQPAVAAQLPASLPLLLVLVAARVALAGPRLDVVEPDVFGPGTVGPRLFAGHRAGVAADALVEVHHHRHLGHDSHGGTPSRSRAQYSTGAVRLRIIVTSSRWFPVGP